VAAMTRRPVRPVLLVLRALGLGDLLTGIPALRALARAFPDHRLVLAAPRWLAPLVPVTRAVEDVVETDPLGPIAVRRPAVAVNLHGAGPESHRRLLETEPGRLIAFRHPEVPESAGMPVWRDGEHEVGRWCRLLEESGIPTDRADLRLDADALPRTGARGGTLIHPGGKDPTRRWPPERWAEVARAEHAGGRRVLVSGGPGEEELARTVASLAGLGEGAVRLPPDVLALAGLVAAADRLASGDTGVAHLATALRRPLVVLFGRVPPSEWGPPSGGPHVVLWKGRTGLLSIDSTEVARALREEV
jgi:ADP-heptose:LPS heptosyltransferase